MFEAIAFARDWHNGRITKRAIQKCRRKRRILREGGVPLTKWQITGDD